MRKRNRGQGLKIRAGKIRVHSTEASAPAWQTERHTGLKGRRGSNHTAPAAESRCSSFCRITLARIGTAAAPVLSRYKGRTRIPISRWGFLPSRLSLNPGSRLNIPRPLQNTRLHLSGRGPRTVYRRSFLTCRLRSGELRPELGKITILNPILKKTAKMRREIREKGRIPETKAQQTGRKREGRPPEAVLLPTGKTSKGKRFPLGPPRASGKQQAGKPGGKEGRGLMSPSPEKRNSVKTAALPAPDLPGTQSTGSTRLRTGQRCQAPLTASSASTAHSSKAETSSASP